MELEGEARIHLHTAIGRRQLPSGRHLHHVSEGKPRLGSGRQAMEVAMRDGHELGPGPSVLRRVAVEYVARAIGRALRWDLEVMRGNGEKPRFEDRKSVV